MKYFCVGLPRTGTKSLTCTAKMMGLRTSHAVYGGYTPDYDAADFFGDTPVWCDWRELHAKYPDSRFILTVRDHEKWASSYLRMLRGMLNLVRHGPRGSLRGDKAIREKMNYRCYSKVFGPADNMSRAGLIATAKRHRQEVEDHFGSSTLLYVMDLTQPGQLGDFVKWMNIPVVNFPWIK